MPYEISRIHWTENSFEICPTEGAATLSVNDKVIENTVWDNMFFTTGDFPFQLRVKATFLKDKKT